jgi:dihydrofolate reductase (trimethoprim resistance protein)
MNSPFLLGERVRKKSGAAWQGKIVGWYSTKLTPQGYAVESEFHAGSVQIYPASALERVDGFEGGAMTVESGITPKQVFRIIEKMDPDQIADLAGRNPA